MKKLICLLLLLSVGVADAQFRRSSDSNAYPYTATLQGHYLFLISRPGVTNYNYATSNLWTVITNIAAAQAYWATNDFASDATNISAYQAFLATNNFLSTSTNIANYAASNAAYLATNGYSPTVTQVVQYVFTTTGIVSNQFTTNQLFNALAASGSTNYNIIIGSPYRSIFATNDVAFTNVSGTGCASVHIYPNGSDRNIYFPTNWSWQSTNNFTLSGSQWKTGITNGAARTGWLSIVADGAQATNVAAIWVATP